jgi:hypothetical protein
LAKTWQEFKFWQSKIRVYFFKLLERKVKTPKKKEEKSIKRLWDFAR